MQQLGLGLDTESKPRTLVDDATGTIVYAPGVVAFERAAAWFEVLRDTIAWERERRPMYDRVVDVPRLVAWFGPDDELPPLLSESKRVAETASGARFNSIGLNFYRDAADSVAMHSDHNELLVPGSPVVLLSLGTARPMRIQSKAKPRRVFSVLLEPGSLLTMGGAAQEHWEHGIPKLRDSVGPRISLAFRLRQASAPERYRGRGQARILTT
jgi:alkylated DNA repair dioxygenase AlkB